MTGSRELLEAESWQRRRLVAAYLTGSPDGSTRPQLRLVTAALALAATVVAVAVGIALRR